MKKISLFIAALTLTSFSAFAVDRHDSDGCGLGWQITKKHTLLATITRGTTNVFVPPSFGMTSGSLNCQKHSIVKADKIQMFYTEANFENLVAEMAQGQGDFLIGYASTFGCKNKSDFSKLLQKNYKEIVTPDSNPSSLLAATKNIIHTSALSCDQ